MIPEFVKIALTFKDETLGIMTFITRGAPNIYREPTRENIDAECRKAFGHTGNPVMSWVMVSDNAFPKDRTYRNAWRWRGNRVEHDMPAAREIHRGLIRERRAKLFDELTVEQERAGRDATKLDALESRRQRLRDATADPRIEAAKTIEELREIDPLAEKEETRVR